MEYCFVAPVSVVPVIPVPLSGIETPAGIQVPVIARDEAIQVPAILNLPPTFSVPPTSYYRHIAIGANTTFTGTGVLMDQVDIEIITEICGDSARSTLDLLALATDDARISVEGVARVASPYRQVSTRVDQTNILIGTGARVRGVPRLEIATDDIE